MQERGLQDLEGGIDDGSSSDREVARHVEGRRLDASEGEGGSFDGGIALDDEVAEDDDVAVHLDKSREVSLP